MFTKSHMNINIFTQITSPLDQFEIRDLISLKAPILGNLSLSITFHLKDLPLSLMIQKELGFGSLSRKKGVNAYILTINNNEGILFAISLLNGNMRTPKINSLYKLIDFYQGNINIEKKPLNNKSLESDA